jgi:hypothetical protein
MKKFEVYFFSEDKGSFENQKIHAETQEDAFNKFLIGKQSNNYKFVVVSPDSFLDSVSISAKSFPNPLCIPDKIEGESILNTGTGDDIFYLQKTPSNSDKDGPFSRKDLQTNLNSKQIGDQWRVCWGNGSWMLAKDFLKFGPLGATDRLSRPKSNSKQPSPADEGENEPNKSNKLIGVEDLNKIMKGSINFSSEKIDKLIELQEKQLYWIRIIGIPFLFAAIGGFLAILFR